MSMSTHVVGYQEADEEWVAKKAIWDACTKQNITPPEEVLKFFDYENPGDSPGRTINLVNYLTEYNSDCESGYQLDLESIPTKCKFIRFYNSF